MESRFYSHMKLRRFHLSISKGVTEKYLVLKSCLFLSICSPRYPFFIKRIYVHIIGWLCEWEITNTWVRVLDDIWWLAFQSCFLCLKSLFSTEMNVSLNICFWKKVWFTLVILTEESCLSHSTLNRILWNPVPTKCVSILITSHVCIVSCESKEQLMSLKWSPGLSALLGVGCIAQED